MRNTNNINEDSSNKINFNKNSSLNNIKNSSLDDPYLIIDSSNNFRKISLNEKKLINARLKTFSGKKLSSKGISKKDLTKEIIKKFTEKKFQRSDINIYKISSLISSQIKSKRKLDKDIIEEHINFFFNLRRDLTSCSTIVLNKNIFKNIGIILCYVYSKFKDYSIDYNNMKEYINKIIIKKINVLTDYFLFCNTCHDDPSLLKKTYVWKKLIKKNKYEIPPELIFLINIFQKCLKLVIDISSESEILNQEELNLYTITLLNIEYIFPNIEHISINFVHDKLQQLLYNRNYNKFCNILRSKDENIKKNYIKDNISLYAIKWDFEQEFNLVYFNQIKYSEKKKNNKVSIEDFFIVSHNEEKEKEQLSKINNSFANSIISLDNLFFGSNKIESGDMVDNGSEENDKDLSSTNNTSSSMELMNIKNPDIIKREKKDIKILEYKDILNKNSIIFDQIVITILGISCIKTVRKLNLISNEYYIKDIISYMKVNNEIDISSIDNEFHILDSLYNKENGLDLLNIEINSLDIITFNKILEIIYINLMLSSVNISFFSSDVSYLIPNLFKIYYEQIKKPKDIINYVLKNEKNFIIDDYVNKILNEISEYFIKNLETLFEIIKNKNDLKELGFNFDIPPILINNNNYKISIFKFILNILILINNNEIKNISKLKKLTLLAPKIVFDQSNGSNIDAFFKKLSLYSKTNTLINLNIEFQFHQINYIKNLVSTNLFQLCIGDLDAYTFNKLVNYLESYYFCSQSNLSHLSIKLSGMITNFNTQLKLNLQKLFSINLKNLLEMKLYTNLIIDKKANYLFLLKILQNNYIPSYIITLNEKSKKVVNFFHIFGRKKILYLVSESIQNLIFKDSGLNIIRRNSFHSNEIYWILKDLFLYKYKANSNYVGYFGLQYLISTILKYLFFSAEVKLEHKYHWEKNEI